jgi:hypothetical protein
MKIWIGFLASTDGIIVEMLDIYWLSFEQANNTSEWLQVPNMLISK